jgi:hypothetical protein
MGEHSAVVTSTADLTPDGILGYTKGIAVTAGAILVAVAEVVGEDWEYNRWLQLAIAICTIIATISLPNPVKPVTVVDADPPPPPAVPGQ